MLEYAGAADAATALEVAGSRHRRRSLYFGVSDSLDTWYSGLMTRRSQEAAKLDSQETAKR